VDLLGQVSNHFGTELYSGIGGEADLINGSAKSPRGKAIIALPSKTRDGKSRIVPALEPGPVSLCCYRVHYVVTEYGIAYIHGKSLRARALQMISIAAPEFRQELLERAKELKYVYMDQVLPTTEDGCVIIVPSIEWKYETKDKGPVNFRPAKSVDERLLQELYYRLNDEDRRYRFLAQRKTFPHEDIQTRMMCDYQSSLFIVGVVGTEDNPRIIAEGSFYVDENTNLAEVSITIDEEYRGQGLAKHIFNKLIELAKERGIAGFFGEIAADNYAMFHILNLLPYKIVFTERGSTFEFYYHFSDLKEQKE
jgi:GNAT superfamily N-acetyltransferase